MLFAKMAAQTTSTSYVSNSGSDTGAGSLFAPFRTIQYAIDQAGPGTRIIVLEGRYTGHGNVDLNFHGKAITLQSRNPADPACVRATILDAAGEGVIARFVNDEGPGTVLAGFTILFGDRTRSVAKGIPGYLEMSSRARPTMSGLRLGAPLPSALATYRSALSYVMPDGSPAGGRAWDGLNPFVQPAATTDYWGSGDVDGDGAVTSNDAFVVQQMISQGKTPLVAADVNGDGVVDATDVTQIAAAASGGLLPAWWNYLTTREQRNAWLDKVLALEPTKYYTDPVSWFACVQFSIQTFLHGAFSRNDYWGTYFGSGQTWFNIPLYSVSLSWGHAVNAILVGDNPLRMEDWRFIEPQGDYDVYIPGYMLSGTVVDIFVPNQIQAGGMSYMGHQPTVSFLMGDNGSYTVNSHDPNLVLNRPAQPPTVVPDDRPDFWNPHILSAGSGMLLFERQRADLSRADDIHLTDLPFVDPPPATPLTAGVPPQSEPPTVRGDRQFTRLLDVAKGPDQSIHLLWSGGANYIPGVFHGILDVNSRILQNVTRVTSGPRQIHGGRVIVTPGGDVHAFWSARASAIPGYTTGVYWSQWNGASWSAEQNVGPSEYFSDAAGDWRENDTARYFFDVTTDQSGRILLVWAACDGNGNITIRSSRYNGTWSAPVDVEYTGIAGGVALARDAAGLIHLVYWRTGSNPSYTSFGNLLHRTFDGATWSSPDTVDGGRNASTPHLVAAGSALYAVWQRNTGQQRVPVWRRWASSAWSADHILTVRSGADAYYPSADLLGDGSLAITWSSRSSDRASIETASIHEWNLNVSLAHTGSFTQGDRGDGYRITVTNAGQIATTGTITVTDSLPAGLTAAGISGTGWTCNQASLTCSRADALAGNTSYPAITLLVNVADDAPTNVTNSAALSSSEAALIGTNSAFDPTAIVVQVKAPQLSITKSHAGDFMQGQTGAAYTVTVLNGVGAGPTSGTVTVSETLPSGLTLVSITGTGWNCSAAVCTRSDLLNPGCAYPAITVTVNVAGNASSPEVNSITVSGGGSTIASTTDSTVIIALAPAVMNIPLPGATLSGSSVTFTWSGGTGAAAYWFDVGTVQGQGNIFAANLGLAISQTVNGIPADGRPIYVRLWTQLSGAWQYKDYTYTAAPPANATIISPTGGTTLSSTSVTFTWTASSVADQYWLDVGTYLGQGNLCALATSNTSAACSRIPASGGTIHVQLWTHISGAWQPPIRYTYTAPAPPRAQLANPASNSVLPGSSVTFTWNGITGADQYWLDVGTTMGRGDICAGATTSTSSTCSKIPANGSTVFVQLWTHIFGGWQPPIQYTYTASSTARSQLANPTANSVLAGPAVTFSWSAVAGADQYWLDVGTEVGQGNICAGATAGLSSTCSGIPTNGSTVFVQLWTRISGVWQSPNRYTFTAAQLAQLTIPAGSTLSGSVATFIWSAVSGADQYWLDVGTVFGKGNICAVATSNTSAICSGIPMNGSAIYVQLWTHTSGAWEIPIEYTFTSLKP